MTYNNPAEYERIVIISFLCAHWQTDEDRTKMEGMRLDPNIFAVPFHRDIVKTINYLLDEKQICDEFSVEYYIRKSKHYTDAGWTEILAKVPMPLRNVEFYIDLLTRAYKNRLLKGILV